MMKPLPTRAALLTLLLAVSLGAMAQPSQSAATPTDSAPATSAPDSAAVPATQDSDDESERGNDEDQWNRFGRGRSFRHRGDDLVSIGHDSSLPAGGQRDSVVAVFGSASNYGTARGDVVSVFGNTTTNGTTGGSAVAVLGNVAVNADVGQDVVAVLGNVYLGPAAHVHGHVVSVLGTVTQDPAAVVDQGVEHILSENITTAEGLRTWLGRGLLWGRPLVLGAGLTWLWTFSLALLAIYAILALLFREAAEHCIATLNDHPGKSFVTAVLAVLLTPLTLLLLAITIVGIPVIPIFLVTLFIAGIFGKATVLGWIGGRCLGLRPGQTAVHPALAVIMGGIIAMLIYLVPVLGFVAYILLSMIGYGAVLYALLNRVRHTTAGGMAPAAPAPGAGPVDPAPSPEPPAGPAPAQGPAADPAAPPSPPPSAALPLTTLPRGTFWIRMAALFIDAIIVWALIRLLLGWPQEGSNRIGLLALAAYGAVMWKVKGTTIGGIACDLRVVRLDSRPIDWPTACVRALGCILSLCALGLGFFWIAFDPGQQAWHDKLAGTIVVRVPRGTPLA